MPASAAGLQLCKKETLAQTFSSEFCGISKNTFFAEHLRATASRVQGYQKLVGSEVFVPYELSNIKQI